MKRILLIAAFLWIAYGSYSRTGLIINDTTRPVSERAMTNALRASDSLATMLKERDSLYKAIGKYEALAVKDSVVLDVMKENQRLYNLLITDLKDRIKLYEQKDANHEQIDKNNRTIIRKKNWVIFKKTILPVIATAGAILLFRKK